MAHKSSPLLHASAEMSVMFAFMFTLYRAVVSEPADTVIDYMCFRAIIGCFGPIYFLLSGTGHLLGTIQACHSCIVPSSPPTPNFMLSDALQHAKYRILEQCVRVHKEQQSQQFLKSAFLF